jgi:hypothetical protein
MDPDPNPTLRGRFTLGPDYQRIFKIKRSYWSRAYQWAHIGLEHINGPKEFPPRPGSPVRKSAAAENVPSLSRQNLGIPHSRKGSIPSLLLGQETPPSSSGPTLQAPNKGSTKKWHMLSTPCLLDRGDHNRHPLTHKHTHMW